MLSDRERAKKRQSKREIGGETTTMIETARCSFRPILVAIKFVTNGRPRRKPVGCAPWRTTSGIVIVEVIHAGIYMH